jgi:hypothetical protein
MNCSEYLLPSLLKVHADVPVLIRTAVRAMETTLQALPSDVRQHGEIQEQLTLKERFIWGLVHVCLQSRLLGLPHGGELLTAKDGDFLRLCELEAACMSQNDELRLTALTVIVASIKTTLLPSPGASTIFLATYCSIVWSQRNYHYSRASFRIA